MTVKQLALSLVIALATIGQASAQNKKNKAAAPAAPTTIELTPFELARGQIPKSKTPPAKIGDCVLDTSGDPVTFDPKVCPELAKITKPTQFDPLKVTIAAGTPVTATFSIADGTLSITSDPAVAAVAVPGPGSRWIEAKLTDGKTSDKAIVEAFTSKEQVHGIYGLDSKGDLLELTVSKSKVPGPETREKVGNSVKCVEADLNQWCRKASRDDKLICIDATAGFEPVHFDPENHILAPNTSVSVVVRHSTQYGAEIKQQGTRGLFEATVANYTGKYFDKNEQQGDGVSSCAIATHASFAPRKPGSADIKIELREVGDKTKLVAEHTIELEVAQTYAGAIRLGISAIMGGAVDRAYDSQVAPGAVTREIVRSEQGDVNPEIVVGLSAYVWDIYNHGGRSYVDREMWSYLCPAPYIGVGIIAPKSGEARAIPSLHLGLEWEVSKSFAVSVDAVSRRVTRLSDGFAVGSPVSASTKFTTESYEWGWAVTVSVSPEFLQFATGGKQ